MSTVIDLDPRPTARRSASVDDFIAASGAGLADRIVIAGAAHLEFLIALTRRGYMSVTCQSPNRCPHLRNSKADVILVPAAPDETALLAVLDGLGSALNQGGVLVIEAPPSINLRGDAPLSRALLRRGFSEFAPVAGRTGSGALWRAYKQSAAMVRAA